MQERGSWRERSLRKEMGSSAQLEDLGLGEHGQLFSLRGIGEKAEHTCTDAGKQLAVGVGI